MNIVDEGNLLLNQAQIALVTNNLPARQMVKAQIDAFTASHETEFNAPGSNVAWMRDQLYTAADRLGGTAPNAAGENPNYTSPVLNGIGSFFRSITDDVTSAKDKAGEFFSGSNLKLLAIAAGVVAAAYVIRSVK